MSDERVVCPDCHAEADWQRCENCEDGLSHHDCGEDTCCCLHPEPNVACDTCYGLGGWFNCTAGCGWGNAADDQRELMATLDGPIAKQVQEMTAWGGERGEP